MHCCCRDRSVCRLPCSAEVIIFYFFFPFLWKVFEYSDRWLQLIVVERGFLHPPHLCGWSKLFVFVCDNDLVDIRPVCPAAGSIGFCRWGMTERSCRSACDQCLWSTSIDNVTMLLLLLFSHNRLLRATNVSTHYAAMVHGCRSEEYHAAIPRVDGATGLKVVIQWLQEINCAEIQQRKKIKGVLYLKQRTIVPQQPRCWISKSLHIFQAWLLCKMHNPQLEGKCFISSYFCIYVFLCWSQRKLLLQAWIPSVNI